MSLSIEGSSGGALLDGRRIVTELGKWSAATRDEGGIRVICEKHVPDPYEWQLEHQTLTAELEVGRAVWRGPAEIESKDPLVFVMSVED